MRYESLTIQREEIGNGGKANMHARFEDRANPTAVTDLRSRNRNFCRGCSGSRWLRTRAVNREHGAVFDDVKRALRESRMLKHGDFSPQDDHRDDQPDRDGRPDDAEYPDVDRVVRRAEFARGPFEETDALAEDEVDHSWCRAACDVR